MKLLEQIRAWKNKHFSDWFWDLLVGLFLSIISLLIWLAFNHFGFKIWSGFFIIGISFVVTLINQLYNELFEPKDFILRMIFPILIQLIQLWNIL